MMGRSGTQGPYKPRYQYGDLLAVDFGDGIEFVMVDEEVTRQVELSAGWRGPEFDHVKGTVAGKGGGAVQVYGAHIRGAWRQFNPNA